MSALFSITPVEAALWNAALGIQTYLADEIFGTLQFTSLVVTVFAGFVLYRLYRVGKGDSAEGLAQGIMTHLLCMGAGLLCLTTVNTDPIKLQDSGGGDWASKGAVIGSSKFKALQNSQEGLYWYTMFHKATTEVSLMMLKGVTNVFSDEMYLKSPNVLFKILATSSSIALDDPKIASEFDLLVEHCSDPKKLNILGKDDSFSALFDLNDENCEQNYNHFQADLRGWAKRKMPGYLKEIEDSNSSFFSDEAIAFTEPEALENKVIASALVSYIKGKAGPRTDDALNVNEKELGLKGFGDQMWFDMQRILTGGGLIPGVLGFWAGDGSVEAGFVKNEAGIIYNNLLNLLPAIRGWIKAYIVISFILVSAALMLGLWKPMKWWLGLIILEMFFLPSAALAYEIHSFFLASSDTIASFGALRNDPMILAGAAMIDAELVRISTIYFCIECAIISSFAVKALRAGWVVGQLSFAHGSAVMGSFISNYRNINETSRMASGAAETIRTGIGTARNILRNR